MIPNKVETEAEFDMSMTTDSSSFEYQEPKKTPKKLRSIRLSRLPSLRSSTRRVKSQSGYCPSVLSGYAASSEQSTPIDMSDASPNYMKATSCSDAKESFQKPARTLTRRWSFKPVKSVTRMSSMKFKRPLMRKSIGGTDLKTKLKKSRSVKVVNFMSSRASSRGVNSQYDASPNYLKPTSCSNEKKVHFQASPRNSESSFGSNQSSKHSSSSMPNSPSPGNKCMIALTRTSSLKPIRIFTKKASFKSKRPPTRKRSEFSQFPGPTVERATCSSTLKASKYPDQVEPQPGGTESEGISVMKVCPYSYCSIHGHRHAALPPLKRFVSMRRRLLKSQKSIKPEGQIPLKTKRSGNTKKGIQTHRMVRNGDPAVQEKSHDSTAISSITEESGSDSSVKIYAGPKVQPNGVGTHGEDNGKIGEIKNLSEILLGEASYPHLSFRENLCLTNEFLTAEQHTLATFPVYKEKCEEYCCIRTEPDETISAATATQGKKEGIVVSNAHNGDDFILTDDHPKFIDFSSAEVKEPKQCDKLSLKPDDSVSTCHEEIPTDGQIHQRSNEDTVSSPNLEKQKNFRFWHLIYQNMVTGIAAEAETQSPHDGADKEEQVEDARTLLGRNDSGSCQGLSGADQNMSTEDHVEGSQKIELYKTDAIKLVQEAFDRILSEIQDHSSDDQSVMSETTSDKELLEKNHGEGEELSSSTSDSAACTIIQPPEEKRLKADNTNTSKEEKAASKEGNKSNQQLPKGWSNLKKIIILKRFVKALEKVRNINPGKPRYLAVEPDPEAEKVHLRHQTTEERKNAEEWMLDYALRQVVSSLAPAQKRKVALLVQAFETVIPLPGIETRERNPAASSQATPAQACIESLAQIGDETRKKNNFGILLHKRSYPEISFKENLDKVSDFCRVEQQIPTICAELKETSSECGCTKTASDTRDTDSRAEEIAASNLDNGDDNSILRHGQRDIGDLCLPELEEPRLCDMPSLKPDDSVTNSNEEFPVNGKILQEVPIQETSISDSEVRDGDPEFNSEKSDSSNVINATGEQSNKPKIPTAANEEEAKSENKCLQGLPPLEESEPNCNTDVAHETQLEKQKHTRLWYLIYKHMVSGSEAKDGNQPLLEGADEEDQGDHTNTLLRMNNVDSCQGLHEADQNIHVKNHNAGAQNFELCQTEAIKLVEEAIDEIPLPEIQDDSPDDQSITSDKIPDDELLEKCEGGDFSSSTSADSAKNSFGESNKTKVEQSTKLEPKETRFNSVSSTTEEEAKSVKEGNKSKSPKQNWSNLKKLILLKRFIKALEKVKTFNPRGPRFLPSDPDPAAEKVNLRRQDTEDRRNAEEWMLDYALQQVVAKLTPARKRKVALLVEAFESVTPTIGS